MNIKYFLLLILLSYSYQSYQCLQSYKTCNFYNSPQIANCIIGMPNQCLECQENYSLSNDHSRCINVPNCAHFDEEGNCEGCQNYYNFNDEEKCVKDYCMLYNPDNEEKTCLQCYIGFYKKDNECVRIPIPYCQYGDDKTCTSCATGATLEDGRCKIPETFVEGCYKYNEDRTCQTCESGYNLENGICTFQNQCQGYPTIDVCTLCKDGYYSSIYTHQCIGYDGSTEKSKTNKAIIIKFKFTFSFLFLLSLI